MEHKFFVEQSFIHGDVNVAHCTTCYDGSDFAVGTYEECKEWFEEHCENNPLIEEG